MSEHSNNEINNDEMFTQLSRTPSGPVTVLDEKPTLFNILMGQRVYGWQLMVGYLTVIAADICLYKNAGGTGSAVLVLVMAIALAAARFNREIGGWALGGIIVLSLSGVWNAGWLSTALPWLFLVFFALKMHRPKWSLTELLWSVPWVVILAPLRGINFIAATLSSRGEGEKRPSNVKIILLPFFLTVLFMVIFYAASPAFEALIDKITNQIWRLVREINFARVFFWAFWICVFATLLSPAIHSIVNSWLGKRREVLAEKKVAPEFDAAPALASLICVNVLFAIFIIFDNYHFVSGREIPNDMSYSEYAKRGCLWLTIALLTSTAVIGLFFKGPLNFHRQAPRLRKLAWIWAAQNMVLGFCALWRLAYYVEYNGLTRARMRGVFGIVLVVAGLVFVVIKVSRQKNFLWLLRRDLAALFVALTLFAVTPVDYICWTYNVNEAMNGNLRPLSNFHIQKLSSEALPPLLPLLSHKNETVRKGIAGLLGQRLAELAAREGGPWQKWQGSDAYALKRLAKAAPEIWKAAPQENWAGNYQNLLKKVRPWYDSGNWNYRLE